MLRDLVANKVDYYSSKGAFGYKQLTDEINELKLLRQRRRG